MLQYWYDAVQIFTVMSIVQIFKKFYDLHLFLRFPINYGKPAYRTERKKITSYELKKKIKEYEKCPDDSYESYENVWHC